MYVCILIRKMYAVMAHVTQFLTLLSKIIRTALSRITSLFLLVRIRAVLCRATSSLLARLLKKCRTTLSQVSSLLIFLRVKTR